MSLPVPAASDRLQSLWGWCLLTLLCSASLARADDALIFDREIATPAADGAERLVAVSATGDVVEFAWSQSVATSRLEGRPLGVRTIGRNAVALGRRGRLLLFVDTEGQLRSLELDAATARAQTLPIGKNLFIRSVLDAAYQGETLYVLAEVRESSLMLLSVSDGSAAAVSKSIPGIEAASAMLFVPASGIPLVLGRAPNGDLVELAVNASSPEPLAASRIVPRMAGPLVRLSVVEPAVVTQLGGGEIGIFSRKGTHWSRVWRGQWTDEARLVAGRLQADGRATLIAVRPDGTVQSADINTRTTAAASWQVHEDVRGAGVLLESKAGIQYVPATYLSGALAATQLPGPVLTIDSVAPAVHWTAEALFVNFTFHNYSPNTLSGTVRITLDGVSTGAASVGGAPAGSFDVSNVPLGGSVSGSLAISAGASAQSSEIAVTFSQTGRLTCLLATVLRPGKSAPQNPRTALPGVEPCSGFAWAQAFATVSIHEVKESLATDDPDPAPAFASGERLHCTSLTHCGNGRLDPPDAETLGTCPVDASASRLRAYNSQIVCSAAMDPLTLQTEADVISLVKLVTGAAKATQRKIRVAGASHTGNPQICTDGFSLSTERLRAPNARAAVPGEVAAILRQPGSSDSDEVRSKRLERWNNVGYPVVEEFEGQTTVRVAPGASLFDLADWLWQRPDQNDRAPEQRDRRSLGLAIPGFRSPTVAGAIATGTHGSSTKWPDVISQRVASVRMVTASGDVQTFSAATTGVQKPEQWRAIKANLGYLGIVTELRLIVEPAFKLRTRITTVDGATLFAPGNPQALLAGCDFGQMMWFPEGDSASAGHARVICGVKTDANTPGDADSRLLDPLNGPLIAGWTNVLGQGVGLLKDCGEGVWDMLKFTASNANEKDFKLALSSIMLGQMGDAVCNGESLCKSECVRRVSQELMLPIIGMSSIESEVVGPAHRIVSSPVPASSDQPLQRDWEIFVPAQNAAAVLREAHNTYAANKTCLPLVGVFLRFALANKDTLMAHTTALGPFVDGEPGMFFEAPVFLPQGARCGELKRYEAPHYLLADKIIEQFGGRPHWAKNRRSLFQAQRRLDPYGANERAFQHVVESMDPTGLFANQFGRDIGLRWADDVFINPDDNVEACVPDNAIVP